MGGAVFILSVALLVLLIGIGVFIALYWRAQQSLERYSKIQDAEAYMADCERKAKKALQESERLSNEAKTAQAKVAELKKTISHYSTIVGKFQSIRSLDEKLAQQSQELETLSATIGQAKTVVDAPAGAA